MQEGDSGDYALSMRFCLDLADSTPGGLCGGFSSLVIIGCLSSANIRYSHIKRTSLSNCLLKVMTETQIIRQLVETTCESSLALQADCFLPLTIGVRSFRGFAAWSGHEGVPDGHPPSPKVVVDGTIDMAKHNDSADTMVVRWTSGIDPLVMFRGCKRSALHAQAHQTAESKNGFLQVSFKAFSTSSTSIHSAEATHILLLGNREETLSTELSKKEDSRSLQIYACRGPETGLPGDP